VTEEYCWAITDGGEFVLRPIRIPCVGVWISTGLPCTASIYKHS